MARLEDLKVGDRVDVYPQGPGESPEPVTGSVMGLTGSIIDGKRRKILSVGEVGQVPIRHFYEPPLDGRPETGIRKIVVRR